MRSPGFAVASLFLLTPLREGRHRRCHNRRVSGNISTHAPAGGATPVLLVYFATDFKFLLTPLREGRRPPGQRGLMACVISTHAPAGGATVRHVRCLRSDRPFLLTPLREGRPRLASNGRFCAAISTHAPAGGATPPLRFCSGRRTISTHAPAGGATRGAWFPATVVKYFYSRPCGRGDAMPGGGPKGVTKISTHAPAGGATDLMRKAGIEVVEFLLTPLREGRPRSSCTSTNHALFLLTPLREGRPTTCR